MYYYTFSTPADRGVRMVQTTAQTARNACPVGASLYRRTSRGWQYLGFRRDSVTFCRITK